ncbi:MAG: hypothetical protein ACE5K9_00205 [Candidatus Methylomirabilales bacterium]
MRYSALALLVLSLVVPGCSSDSPPPQPARASRPGQSKRAGVARQRQTSASRAVASRGLEPIRYRPEGRRDPFHPLVEPPSEETAIDVGGYKLAGIVWQRNQYFALLETPDGLGHIIKEDDRLGPDARVKEITKDAVLIEMKGRSVAGRPRVRTIRLELEKKEGR